MEMRRLLVLIAVVGLLVGAMAAPASADSGEVTTETRVFEDLNACTGEIVTVTLEITFVTHDHGTNTVINWTGLSSDSAGYAGTGEGKIVANDNMGLLRERFAWSSTNAETGLTTLVYGWYIVEIGEPVVPDEFVMECVA